MIYPKKILKFKDIFNFKNFFLKSLDENLDKKLLDLADILNETLKAAIFG